VQIELLHYNFKLAADKLDSLRRRDFLSAEIDELLNQAQLILVSNAYSGANSKRVSFEEKQEMTDLVSALVVKSPSDIQPCLSPVSTEQYNSRITRYEFDLGDLEFQYYHYISAVAKLDGCDIRVYLTTHDKLYPVLDDPFRGPSATWKRVVGVFGKTDDTLANSRSIYIYSEEPVNELCIEYVKLPIEMTIGGYNDINNVPKVRTESELPDEYHNRIIDIAVLLAQGIVENEKGYQIASQKLQINS
jgi:hypothetical protein